MADRQKHGFTLLELLIVIGIMSIMTTVVLSNYRGPKSKKIGEGAARETAAMVREAQQYALTGTRVVYEGAGTQYPCAYTLAPSGTNGIQMSYLYRLAGGRCAEAQGPQEVYTYTFAEGISVSNFSPIWFTVPHGTNSTGLTQIIISYKNDQYSICVYESGNIIEKDGDSCI